MNLVAAQFDQNNALDELKLRKRKSIRKWNGNGCIVLSLSCSLLKLKVRACVRVFFYTIHNW